MGKDYYQDLEISREA